MVENFNLVIFPNFLNRQLLTFIRKFIINRVLPTSIHSKNIHNRHLIQYREINKNNWKRIFLWYSIHHFWVNALSIFHSIKYFIFFRERKSQDEVEYARKWKCLINYVHIILISLFPFPNELPAFIVLSGPLISS